MEKSFKKIYVAFNQKFSDLFYDEKKFLTEKINKYLNEEKINRHKQQKKERM